MKAQELRIGNWIYNVYSRFIQVQNIQQDSFNLKIDGEGVAGSYSLEYYSGIPLTPEILLKCGFDKGVFFEFTNGIILDYQDEGYIMLHAEDLDNLIRYPLSHVKFLHQLQNLFYSLTGEELQITL